MIFFDCHVIFVCIVFCFFFNDTATTEIYTYGHTLSLHDALPISKSAALRTRETSRRRQRKSPKHSRLVRCRTASGMWSMAEERAGMDRSEEHTSELQSLMRISYAVFCLKK